MNSQIRKFAFLLLKSVEDILDYNRAILGSALNATPPPCPAMCILGPPSKVG